MSNEKQLTIQYDGSLITILSNDSGEYMNLTELAKAYKTRKSILTWLRNVQTIDFMHVWEKKYNQDYDGAQMSTIYGLIKKRALSIKQWVDTTNAKGIVARTGERGGTYAHKDIAIRFAGWLNPEYELYLVEEIQRLKELERQKNSFELLSHNQILALVQLKEVFKYVAHQELIEDAHKDVFAAQSGSNNPFADFHKWRNEILDIDAKKIDERIKEFCERNKIAVTKKILNKNKRDKILTLDSYEAVRNAVWDFLSIKGDVNALNLANLVSDMMRVENGEVLRKNEDTLFEQKKDLGQFNDFDKILNNTPKIRTAREVLAIRAEQKKLLKSPMNTVLKGMLSVPPMKKEDETNEGAE
jgi:hypothetical protein